MTVRHTLRRAACGVVTAILVLVLSMSSVMADPAADALAKLEELSRQAIETREAVTNAQREVEAKLAEQAAALERNRADQEALAAANAQLEVFQDGVDRAAATAYMSGRHGQLSPILTASSPQQLLDHLSLQRVVGARTADQMKAFRATREQAAAAAEASEKSAADAKAAADKAAALSAELKGKWRELQKQILAAEAQYAALTPQQQAIVDNATAPPPPAAPPPADPMLAAMPGQPPVEAAPPPVAALMDVPDVPEALPVGVAPEAGLQPHTVLAARAVSARFPQIGEIGGVRPDSKPWHPNGLAIDIMIPNPDSPEGIALGDEILAFAMANAGRFRLQDVIWRGTYYTPSGPAGSGYGHYDHVHITTMPG